MFQILLIVHVIATAGIIGLVLMQQGKGADAGAAFGAGASASGTVFGSQGAGNFLSRTTALFAVIFFSTSLSLAWLSGNKDAPADIMDGVVIEQVQNELPTTPEDVVKKIVANDSDIPVLVDEKIAD
ncbi:MAG: preprotein translocase subunit SecG [Gammaproteobacteria bacterium]|nr:MAG: preprotein translocase subunit SecG [Gammaproteobacteria bacterium]